MKTIGYWATTAILAFVFLSGGIMQLLRKPQAVEGMVHLGYPVYFVVILGFWKALGGIALLVPRFPRLKEWAYAGVFFDLTGAAASYVGIGELNHIIGPLIFAVIAMASWALRPSSRMLGAILPAKTQA